MIHIIPYEELQDHDASVDCGCDPDQEDGDGFVVVRHNAEIDDPSWVAVGENGNVIGWQSTRKMI